MGRAAVAAERIGGLEDAMTGSDIEKQDAAPDATDSASLRHRLDVEISRRKAAEKALSERNAELRRTRLDLHNTVTDLQGQVQQRREAEHAAGRERNRLYAVLNLLPGYAVLKDFEFNIRFANHGFLDAFGHPEGRPCHLVQWGLDHPCDNCPRERIGRNRIPEKIERRLPDGRRCEVSIFPFTDSDGTDLMLEMAIDITERRELERAVSDVSDAERRRIGRELHDTLGQTMTGLGYLVGGLVDRLAGAAPEERETAELIVENLNEATAQVRLLARGLDPVGLEAQGLAAALKELASGFEVTHGVPCRFDGDVDTPIDPGTAAHLYRLAQEATTNCVKHARATRIDISLFDQDDGLVLQVRDNGVGVAVEEASASGMGLRTMRYRAGAIDAKLYIVGVPGEGTSVTCVLPVDQAGEGGRR